MYAYDPGNSKKTVIYVIVGVLILSVIGIIIFIVNSDDEEDPDAPEPAPAPASVLTAEEVRAIVAENNSQLSAADIATIVAAGNSGSNWMSTEDLADLLAENNADNLEQILQIIEERSDDSGANGGGDSGGGGVNRCKDIKQYKNAKECEDINSDSEAEEKCKEGRWVNSESRENKAVLCKWDNNDGCVTDSDCESDTDSVYTPDESPGGGSVYTPDYDQADINFCQEMIDEKEVIPMGVDGETGGTMDDSDRTKWRNKKCNEMHENGVITYTPVDTPDEPPGGGGGDIDEDKCKLLRYQLIDALKEVDISSSTIGDVKGQEKCTGVGRAKKCEQEIERNRKFIRDKLNGIISDMNDELDKETCGDESNGTLAIVDKIKDFNVEFIQEKEDSESEKYTGKGYSNVNIEFEDINWPFENVESPEDLQNVLEDSEAFKNYEPYHNGNPRSSRKVPKPYDEHFVNFRSY